MNDNKAADSTNLKYIYDKLADSYDLIFGLLLRHGQKMAIHALDISSGTKVLEVGIGTGLTLPFYPKGTHIFGIDISGPMLKKAQERMRALQLKDIELQQMSADSLNFDDNSFDRVFAPSVLSVVTNPEKVVDEMVRVCKPGGFICVVAHFAGSRLHAKVLDRIFDPWTRRLFDFRMTTAVDVIEKHPRAPVVLKKNVLALNFSTLYLLQKVES